MIETWMIWTGIGIAVYLGIGFLIQAFYHSLASGSGYPIKPWGRLLAFFGWLPYGLYVLFTAVCFSQKKI